MPYPVNPQTGVSVVVPVRNDAFALARCLEALSRQSRLPDEIIVVDNGSTDDGPDGGGAHDLRAVAARWGARLLHEPEPGILAASTTGYDAARFSVIARLDADTLPPPEWIASGLAVLSARPEIAAVTGPATFYDGPRHGAGVWARAYVGAYIGSIRLAIGMTPLFGSTFFLRTTAWHAVASVTHRWGTSLHDDLDLSIHLAPAHRVIYDRSVTVGISFRPFVQWRSLGYRFHRGFMTLALHWPGDSALLRWRRRLGRRARLLTGAGRPTLGG
ncbi:glycosyltransferase family 2 protein [Subtercola boreus]|uniref:glycosyltransferase family 2 protein n=1 Tax=Subtercola boreus TaxID=120213 RepID=UPI001473492F|nr:glycosyltransferase family 2 protein [Subtercola boreus]